MLYLLIYVLLNLLPLFSSHTAELDALYLDPKPYLNLKSQLNSKETTRRIKIFPSAHLEWFQQRDAARKHVMNGDLDIAKQQFQSIIMTKSSLLPARVVAGLHLELGDVFLQMGDDDQSKLHYLEAQAFVPEAYLPHVRLAKLSIRLGHFNKGIEHLKHALFFNHSHLMSLHEIGSLLFIQCKVEEAWYYFDVAIHGTNHPERYQRVSLLPEEGLEETSEEKQAKLIRNSLRNTPSKNYYHAVWLTGHVMGLFDAKEEDRYIRIDEKIPIKLKEIESSSDIDRTIIISYTLNLLSFHLNKMGLYEEAVNIWKTLHASEERISTEEESETENKELNLKFRTVGLTFLTQYANAAPKILDLIKEPDLFDEMWERKKIITERLNLFTSTTNKSMVEHISYEPTSHYMSVANIVCHSSPLRTLRSQTNSDTLSLLEINDDDDDKYNKTISIVDSVRIVSEKSILWTSKNIPTLHHLKIFESMKLPPSDPSQNISRRKILRLAGKARLQRKLKRSKQRKNQRDPSIKVKEERRDKRASAYTAYMKKRKKHHKNSVSDKSMDDSVLLPIIRVGFICESFDPYMYNISSPVAQHIRLLLKSTVSRHHVTMYIPQWKNNQKKTEEIKHYFYNHILTDMMDDHAILTRASELSIQNLTGMEEKYRHIFTMKELPSSSSNTKKSFVPRVDIMIFVAPALDETAHYLAHTRLAPVQVGLWGGTGTSGLGMKVGQLDYFVTSDMIHRSEGHRSYTEQMVRLPYAGTMLPEEIQDLPQNARFGSPPQYMFKYRHKKCTLYLYARHNYVVILHNEMHEVNDRYDKILATLLSMHDNLHVLLVATSKWNGKRENPLGYGRLVARIRRTIDRSSNHFSASDNGKNNSKGNDDKYGSSLFSTVKNKQTMMKTRVRHITGLSRSDYLSLLAAVNLVLDPSTNDGRSTENGLLSTLETMMIGTPVVTLHPSEEDRGWDRVQPTSSVAALIESVGGGNITKHCVAKDEIDYINKVNLLLNNFTLQKTIRKVTRKKTRPWIEMQNKVVEKAWFNFLERVGRPYANWRLMDLNE